MCLRALAQYEDAKKEFESFVENYTTNDDYKKNAEAELKNLQFIIAQMKSKEQKLYVVNKMQAGVNTTEHGQTLLHLLATEPCTSPHLAPIQL